MLRRTAGSSPVATSDERQRLLPVAVQPAAAPALPQSGMAASETEAERGPGSVVPARRCGNLGHPNLRALRNKYDVSHPSVLQADQIAKKVGMATGIEIKDRFWPVVSQMTALALTFVIGNALQKMFVGGPTASDLVVQLTN